LCRELFNANATSTDHVALNTRAILEQLRAQIL
jgi:hypothetical protein